MGRPLDLRADDMLRFQDEIAQQVTEGLKRSPLTSRAAVAGLSVTNSPEAYDLYLHARFHWTEYSARSLRDSLKKGEKLLERAIDLDAAFAPAHALLSFLLFYESCNYTENAPVNLAGAQAMAERALAIDRHFGEAWVALEAPMRKPGAMETRRPHAAASRGTGPELRARLGHARLCLPLRRPRRAGGGFVPARAGAESDVAASPLDARAHAAVSRPDLGGDRGAGVCPDAGPREGRGPPGKFLYYEGRMEEAERVFTSALRHNEDLHEPAVPVLAAYLYASRGERERIDSSLFALQTDEVFDGDRAYWQAGVFALLGRPAPPAGCPPHRPRPRPRTPRARWTGPGPRPRPG